MGDDDHDDSGGEDTDRAGPGPASRFGRGSDRRPRPVSRTTGRYVGRDRYRRQRKLLPVAELIGNLIKHHGLTEEIRQRLVGLYWTEIAGERIATRSFPASFAEGVLQVSATSSSWVQELQFFKVQLLAQINNWINANRVRLGPSTSVADIRFSLAGQQQKRLVDPEDVRQLRVRHLRQMAPRESLPPIVSDAEREAIRTETSRIEDAELRAVIEAVRTKWNR